MFDDFLRQWSAQTGKEFVPLDPVQDYGEYVDGKPRLEGTSSSRGLRGKPAPDTFLEASRMLGAEPRAAAVFEDALAGVAAGRACGFGLVVGIDRVGQEAALRARGADVVVRDLTDLLLFHPLARMRAGRATGGRCP
jgi:hypothetical protein